MKKRINNRDRLLALIDTKMRQMEINVTQEIAQCMSIVAEALKQVDYIDVHAGYSEKNGCIRVDMLAKGGFLIVVRKNTLDMITDSDTRIAYHISQITAKQDSDLCCDYTDITQFKNTLKEYKIIK